jgi:hypothetical protein
VLVLAVWAGVIAIGLLLDAPGYGVFAVLFVAILAALFVARPRRD